MADERFGGERIVVFSTKENLKIMAESSDLFVDGTFKSTPALFYQMLSVHAFVGEKLLPLAYCLLTSKSRSLYTYLLRMLKDKVMEHCQQDLFPTAFHCDFESGLLPAIQSVFPLSRITGCFFHMAQAVLRKVGNLGFKQWYQEINSEFRKFVRRLIALAFLPVGKPYYYY